MAIWGPPRSQVFEHGVEFGLGLVSIEMYPSKKVLGMENYSSHSISTVRVYRHSSTLAWQIPWTEESGRLQSMGLRRVGHD